ncbi:glycosyl hydrolase 115 family protein [Prevotella copri]|uniref:Glycosyl hydrolase 115 family protein n=1 Tax=Segatella copri TaxID=165179 RepID=A0AAW4NCL6_9BACT|nr:glycosyl hydrolase 115 family protein [Segatella copri]MBU9911479.1 glycosyl hydrolase 115 family protein [Segatella copri]MBV3399157.1 glycosyl hydrolase 115 family protein [Segatella copri]MBV3408785.1 glycosyl hydrolase 115 family protein [Segatella copri]MBV3411689.1 glycosyl hydrolase 115 family protein [Segatella copri]MBV3420153.1 glycosyl hydrolase 115 family protein [Segatella copri]
MKLNNIKRTFLASAALLSTISMSAADRFVNFKQGDLLLNANNRVEIYMDTNDCKGVSYAAHALLKDIKSVSGATATLTSDAGFLKKADTARPAILVGTIGHSAAIDQLVKQKRINGNLLKGKREKFIITLIDGQLVIAGSDRRGTIYGIYELSQQMGVSPWYDWADVPVEHHDSIFVNKGIYTDGKPAVRYRGIFLNDEAPCLTSWVKNTYGTGYGDHRFYQRVFELVLRLRGNMMWPAMWGWAFYADDPENEKTADEMGVVMSTSHHEPMARNHQEYARNRKGWGPWNYQKNKANLQKFFREGIERMKGTEQIVTIGMRGDGDEAMSAEADTKLMTNIINDQRKIIADVTGKKASETPQVWALYKEVLDYYDKGMKVPDDVTLLLCDDNWGNVRRVPNAQERKHKGGWGLYYHVDYVGAPRNSKMLNCTPVQNPWEQLTLAYENGIDRLWILNVGDLKPMEYPISQFMDIAWNPHKYAVNQITNHTRDWCAQQFGEEQADEAARLLNLICKYNGRCTPEMLDKNTYSLENGEWQEVVNQYLKIEADALRQYNSLPAAYHDAYRQIILFPIEVMSNLHQMYFAQAMNNQLYEQGNPKANIWADECENHFKRDSLICDEYNHKMAGGKWNGMMTQKHIGYTSWNDAFEKDTCPKLFRVSTSSNETVIAGNDGVVEIEAPYYSSKTDAAEAKWTEIPFMGKSVSAMTLMPYTKSVKEASITYKFKMQVSKTSDGKAFNGKQKVRIHVITKSTLDYLNKGGLTYGVSLDGASPVEVNFNKDLNEKPENIYNIYYPTIATRIVDKVIELELPVSSDGIHTLTLTPNDPAIVFEKIVIDGRGGKKRVKVI